MRQYFYIWAHFALAGTEAGVLKQSRNAALTPFFAEGRNGKLKIRMDADF